MKSLNDLKIQLYADGADKAGILDLYAKPYIKGLTTNPSLMKKAGINVELKMVDWTTNAGDLGKGTGGWNITITGLCSGPLLGPQQWRLSLAFAQNPERPDEHEPDRKWLLLMGSYGAGKTHLAAAIANQCLHDGKPALFLNTPDLLDYLREAYSPAAGETYSERFDEIRDAPLLILDDLGTESPTPWAVEKLYQLLNARYNAQLPTVITTNKRLEDLEPRIGSRLAVRGGAPLVRRLFLCLVWLLIARLIYDSLSG